MTESNVSEEKRKLYQYQARVRAGSKIKELVKENNLCYHWSITYAENITDRKKAIKDFKNFVIRLKKKLQIKELPYVAVMELQERGAIHFHLAIPIWVSHELMTEVWGSGHVWVEKNSGDIRLVAGYFSKYLKKDMEKNPSGDQKKKYLNSKGLKRANKGNGMLTNEEVQEILEVASYEQNIPCDDDPEKTKATFAVVNMKELMRSASSVPTL